MSQSSSTDGVSGGGGSGTTLAGTGANVTGEGNATAAGGASELPLLPVLVTFCVLVLLGASVLLYVKSEPSPFAVSPVQAPEQTVVQSSALAQAQVPAASPYSSMYQQRFNQQWVNVRLCPNCGGYYYPATGTCPSCGATLPTMT